MRVPLEVRAVVINDLVINDLAWVMDRELRSVREF